MWARIRAIVCGCSLDKKLSTWRGSARCRNSNGGFSIDCFKLVRISLARFSPSDASSMRLALSSPPIAI
jgi:hypothetical protein